MSYCIQAVCVCACRHSTKNLYTGVAHRRGSYRKRVSSFLLNPPQLSHTHTKQGQKGQQWPALPPPQRIRECSRKCRARLPRDSFSKRNHHEEICLSLLLFSSLFLRFKQKRNTYTHTHTSEGEELTLYLGVKWLSVRFIVH